MGNDIDNQLDMMQNASAGVRQSTADSGISADNIQMHGMELSAQEQQRFMEMYMKELNQDDPASTIGQPGGGGTQKIVYAQPRDIIVMPQTPEFNEKACHSGSWWTRTLAPIPKFEKDLSYLSLSGRTIKSVGTQDIKYPPAVPNFPIHFDRMLGYREFLS